MLFIFSVTCLLSNCAHALILVSNGNQPIQNRGWPVGSVAVANHPSRLGYREGPPFGGGEYYFAYNCKDTSDFNTALQKFGLIRVPRRMSQSLISLDGQRTCIMDNKPLLLVLHDWTKKESWSNRQSKEPVKDKTRIDWTFTIWAPENFHNLFSSPKGGIDSNHPNFRQPVPPPRIDVYLGDESPINWEEVKIPAPVKVIDMRAEATPTSVEAGGVVRGGVFDMATHQIIVGADVILTQRTKSCQWKEAYRTKTNKDGFFEIQSITKGYYKLHACAEGYTDRNLGVYHNRTGHAFFELDALLIKMAFLKGFVLDIEGNPISGVKVNAWNTLGIDGLGYECSVEPRVTTDENGRFELDTLPEGFTQLRCRASSLHQETASLNLYRVSAKPWRKPDPVKIIMTDTGMIRGKVIGKDGNPPQRDFIAEIEPKGGYKVGTWGGSMNCKKDGSFEFREVPPGDYVVIAKPNPMREGEASEPKPITITVGRTVELEIVNDYSHNKKGK